MVNSIPQPHHRANMVCYTSWIVSVLKVAREGCCLCTLMVQAVAALGKGHFQDPHFNVCLQVKYIGGIKRYSTRQSQLEGPSVIELCRNAYEPTSFYKKIIPIDSLPKSLFDAVMITRGPGIPYLWVDSLCIMQDSLKDWQIESSRVSDVHMSAFLVLAATEASDSNGGFFLENRTKSLQLPYLNADGRQYFLYARKIQDQISDHDANGRLESHGLHDSELRRRGWVLQEQVLARRTLSFANHRPLTYQTDKLPAISGIAKLLHDMTKDDYYAGLWRSQLPGALLWTSKKDNSEDTESEKCIPSWSWASIRSGSITYEHKDEEFKAGMGIVSVDIQLSGSNTFGGVLGGKLEAKAVLIPIKANRYSPYSISAYDAIDPKETKWTIERHMIYVNLDPCYYDPNKPTESAIEVKKYDSLFLMFVGTLKSEAYTDNPIFLALRYLEEDERGNSLFMRAGIKQPVVGPDFVSGAALSQPTLIWKAFAFD
ncbi:hypothetical protein BGAL_0014g00140 [Botrytis galanthina]|uniref:Heterokaryon incompatibility domain-containing protein n=1 Tax=Botrytis galanthina TaxID=278940 RepID=A0A4S8RMV7_9HELO|nr:hypothetical protein BGAL_0014g00140 [Botrytis galanthina]